MNVKKIKRIYTHSGVFHADDVFCVALLRNLGCEAEIVRTFKVPETLGDGEIVLDLGGEFDGISRFDHHQADGPVRENGVKYAAFGELVKALGICNEQGFESFDEKFVCGIDARDNGQFELLGMYPSPVGDTIKEFIPSWDSSQSMDEAFKAAISFAQGILEREFKNRRSAAKAREIVLEAAERSEDGIVVLPRFCPWQDTLSGEDYRAVVFPALRGGYNAQVVPRKGRAFPKEWLEKRPEGCTFVHQGLYLLACVEQEDAIRLANCVQG